MRRCGEGHQVCYTPIGGNVIVAFSLTLHIGIGTFKCKANEPLVVLMQHFAAFDYASGSCLTAYGHMPHALKVQRSVAAPAYISKIIRLAVVFQVGFELPSIAVAFEAQTGHASLAFEAWKSGRLSTFQSFKKGTKRFFQAMEGNLLR